MRITKDNFLFTRHIAHRGLWGNEILENSLSAYKNAVAFGYPIEIDLYLSTDGELFSFHDNTLSRMTGAEGYIYEKSSSELKALRLHNSDESIPTFDEVLSLVNGKVPLLIEIKNQPNKTVVDKVIERLKSYGGEFAIQSFNPLYIKRVKKLAPSFIRGILIGTKKDYKKEKPLTRFILHNMLLNFIIKPDFISVNHERLPIAKRYHKNKAVISWTVTSKDIYEKISSQCDNIIFEHFIPGN